jgi:hypothetical protein
VRVEYRYDSPFFAPCTPFADSACACAEPERNSARYGCGNQFHEDPCRTDGESAAGG